MKDAASTLHLRMAKTAIILKQIYADTPGQGTVVRHLGAGGREAAQEMRALFREAVPEALATKATQRRSKTATG